MSVEHTPVNSIPADADVVLCHAGLAERARRGPGTVGGAVPAVHRRPGGHQGRGTPSGTAASSMAERPALLRRPRSGWPGGRRTGRRGPARRRACWSRSARSSRRTSTRCSSASGRLHLHRRGRRHPARHRRRRRSPDGRRSWSCSSPTASTGTATRCAVRRHRRQGRRARRRSWPAAEILMDPTRRRRSRRRVAAVLDVLRSGPSEEEPTMKVARFHAPATSASRTRRSPTPGPARSRSGSATARPAAPTSRSSATATTTSSRPGCMGHEIAGEIVEVGADVAAGGRRPGPGHRRDPVRHLPPSAGGAG